MTSSNATKKEYPHCRRMLVAFGMGAAQSFELEKAAATGSHFARKWILTIWQLDRQCIFRYTIFHNPDKFLNMKKVEETWKLQGGR